LLALTDIQLLQQHTNPEKKKAAEAQFQAIQKAYEGIVYRMEHCWDDIQNEANERMG
jgi:hypothetical protein